MLDVEVQRLKDVVAGLEEDENKVKDLKGKVLGRLGLWADGEVDEDEGAERSAKRVKVS